MQVTLEFLRSHPDHIFVYGDNTVHRGCRGAAIFRYEPNTYGFITKKFPNNDSKSFYRPNEYFPVFLRELEKLTVNIENHEERTFLITKLGAGLANKYYIWENIIEKYMPSALSKYPNVQFLWKQ